MRSVITLLTLIGLLTRLTSVDGAVVDPSTNCIGSVPWTAWTADDIPRWGRNNDTESSKLPRQYLGIFLHFCPSLVLKGLIFYV